MLLKILKTHLIYAILLKFTFSIFLSYNWFLILCTKFSHKSLDQNGGGGGIPYKELFFKFLRQSK
jgi:hypothetical protein